MWRKSGENGFPLSIVMKYIGQQIQNERITFLQSHHYVKEQGVVKMIRITGPQGPILRAAVQRGQREPKPRDIRFLFHLVGAKRESGGDFVKYLSLPEVVNVILLGITNPWNDNDLEAERVEWKPPAPAKPPTRAKPPAPEKPTAIEETKEDGSSGNDEGGTLKKKKAQKKTEKKTVGQSVKQKKEGKTTLRSAEPVEEVTGDDEIDEDEDVSQGTGEDDVDASDAANEPAGNDVEQVDDDVGHGNGDNDKESDDGSGDDESQKGVAKPVARKLVLDEPRIREKGNNKEEEEVVGTLSERLGALIIAEADTISEKVQALVSVTSDVLRCVINAGKGEVEDDYIRQLEYVKHLGLTTFIVAEVQSQLIMDNISLSMSEKYGMPDYLHDLQFIKEETEDTLKKGMDELDEVAGKIGDRFNELDFESVRVSRQNVIDDTKRGLTADGIMMMQDWPDMDQEITSTPSKPTRAKRIIDGMSIMGHNADGSAQIASWLGGDEPEDMDSSINEKKRDTREGGADMSNYPGGGYPFHVPLAPTQSVPPSASKEDHIASAASLFEDIDQKIDEPQDERRGDFASSFEEVEPTINKSPHAYEARRFESKRGGARGGGSSKGTKMLRRLARTPVDSPISEKPGGRPKRISTIAQPSESQDNTPGSVTRSGRQTKRIKYRGFEDM
jgi:hypothetical protein